MKMKFKKLLIFNLAMSKKIRGLSVSVLMILKNVKHLSISDQKERRKMKSQTEFKTGNMSCNKGMYNLMMSMLTQMRFQIHPAFSLKL